MKRQLDSAHTDEIIQTDLIKTKADYAAFLAADLEAHGIEKWPLLGRFTKPELFFSKNFK